MKDNEIYREIGMERIRKTGRFDLLDFAEILGRTIDREELKRFPNMPASECKVNDLLENYDFEETANPFSDDWLLSVSNADDCNKENISDLNGLQRIIYEDCPHQPAPNFRVYRPGRTHLNGKLIEQQIKSIQLRLKISNDLARKIFYLFKDLEFDGDAKNQFINENKGKSQAEIFVVFSEYKKYQLEMQKVTVEKPDFIPECTNYDDNSFQWVKETITYGLDSEIYEEDEEERDEDEIDLNHTDFSEYSYSIMNNDKTDFVRWELKYWKNYKYYEDIGLYEGMRIFTRILKLNRIVKHEDRWLMKNQSKDYIELIEKVKNSDWKELMKIRSDNRNKKFENKFNKSRFWYHADYRMKELIRMNNNSELDLLLRACKRIREWGNVEWTLGKFNGFKANFTQQQRDIFWYHFNKKYYPLKKLRNRK